MGPEPRTFGRLQCTRTARSLAMAIWRYRRRETKNHTAIGATDRRQDTQRVEIVFRRTLLASNIIAVLRAESLVRWRAQMWPEAASKRALASAARFAKSRETHGITIVQELSP